MQSEVIYLTRVGDKVNYSVRTRGNWLQHAALYNCTVLCSCVAPLLLLSLLLGSMMTSVRISWWRNILHLGSMVISVRIG